MVSTSKRKPGMRGNHDRRVSLLEAHVAEMACGTPEQIKAQRAWEDERRIAWMKAAVEAAERGELLVGFDYPEPNFPWGWIKDPLAPPAAKAIREVIEEIARSTEVQATAKVLASEEHVDDQTHVAFEDREPETKQEVVAEQSVVGDNPVSEAGRGYEGVKALFEREVNLLDNPTGQCLRGILKMNTANKCTLCREEEKYRPVRRRGQWATR
jgi:hypothetical protein